MQDNTTGGRVQSGYGQASDRRQTLDAGFDVHLVKPVEIDRLREVLALAADGATRRTVAGWRGTKPIKE